MEDQSPAAANDQRKAAYLSQLNCLSRTVYLPDPSTSRWTLGLYRPVKDRKRVIDLDQRVATACVVIDSFRDWILRDKP